MSKAEFQSEAESREYTEETRRNWDEFHAWQKQCEEAIEVKINGAEMAMRAALNLVTCLPGQPEFSIRKNIELAKFEISCAITDLREVKEAWDHLIH